jgi:5-carboxymethyl-2-hydroxymuconate isomerase
MPHLIIEYSQQQAGPQQIERLLDAVHKAAVATGLFEESHIRVRALPFSDYRVGGRRAHFIHAASTAGGTRSRNADSLPRYSKR